jgi:tetratricopeptide (TPR) repeat protein
MYQLTNVSIIDLFPHLLPYLDATTVANCWLLVTGHPIPTELSASMPAVGLVALYVQSRQQQCLPQFFAALRQQHPTLEPALAQGLPKSNHPATDYAANLIELAYHHLDHARPALALPLCQEAVDTIANQCGRQHPEYLSSLQDLANCYRYLGQFDAAICGYQEILTIRAQTLGKSHSQYAQSLNDLALIYSEQGQHQQALQLSTEALAIRQALGTAHPDYINGLCYLAYLQRAANQLPAAQQSYQTALDLSKEHHQIPNQLYNNCLQGLGYLYRLQGHYQEATQCYQQLALAQKTQVDQTAYAIALNLWAMAVGQQGDLSQALSLHQQALAIFQATSQLNYAQQTTNYIANIVAQLDATSRA